MRDIVNSNRITAATPSTITADTKGPAEQAVHSSLKAEGSSPQLAGVHGTSSNRRSTEVAGRRLRVLRRHSRAVASRRNEFEVWVANVNQITTPSPASEAGAEIARNHRAGRNRDAPPRRGHRSHAHGTGYGRWRRFELPRNLITEGEPPVG